MNSPTRHRTNRVRNASGKRAATGPNTLTESRKRSTLSLSELDLKSMLGEVVDDAIEILGADFGNIQLLDQESGLLRIAAQRGFPKWWVDFWNSVPTDHGTCGVSLERKERVIVQDVKKSRIFRGKALAIQLKAGVRAVQSTPLVSRAGKLVGVFSTHYKKPYQPDQRTLRLLDLLARLAADVIGKARYSAALRQSEERFKALVTASSYVVYRMNHDWTEVLELDGKGFLSDVRLPGQWLQKHIFPDDQPHLIEAIRRAIRTKSPLMLEHRVRRADGTLGWALSRAVPLLDTNGKISEWFGATSDVTHWKQSEAEAQAVMDLAPVAIFIARDPLCLDITGNRTAYEMVRLPPGSNISPSAPAGQRPDSFRVLKNGIEIPPPELPMQKAAATGRPIHNFEHDLLYQDGTRRSFIGNSVPLFGEDYKPRGAVGTFLDITALKEAEEKFRMFVENAPVAVIIHAPNGRMVIVNSLATRMFGYSRDEMVGQPVEILMPRGLRHRHFEERNEYMKAPTVRPMGVGLELRAKRRDGSEFPVEINLSTLETSAGIFISATIFDLTERKHQEEQTRWATVLAERARMARDVHDTLAQGFTGIVLNLEAAEEAAADLPSEVRIRIQRAQQLARQSLEEARNSILALSSPLPSNGNLTSSLRGLAIRYRPNAKARVEFAAQGTPVQLSPAVEETFMRIAQQAVDNAVQHARAGTIRLGITFDHGQVRLQVEDDGAGFDPRNARCGMGLTGMRERASEINGKFQLASKPGRGTRIRVTVLVPQAQLSEVSR